MIHQAKEIARNVIPQTRDFIRMMLPLLISNLIWFFAGALLIYLSYRQFDRLAQAAVLVRVIGFFLIGKGLVAILFYFVR